MSEGRARERVLVVAGSPFFRRAVSVALAGRDLDVAVEEPADDPCERIERDPPDLLLVDRDVPGMDDFSLIRALRTGTAHDALAVLVAGERPLEPEEIDELERLGASGFVSVFAAPDLLLFRVNHALFAAPDMRRADRVPLSVPVQVRHGSSLSLAYSYNVSSGGMYVRADGAPPPGTAVEVRFALPDRIDPLVVPAVVRHAHPAGAARRMPPGFGLEFRPNGDDARTEVVEYVSRALALEPWVG